MEANWPRGVRIVGVTMRPRCRTAKVLSVRVYIGRSRKRWISSVSRPRAKLLRDVFVVSYAGVRGLWRNRRPVRRGRGTTRVAGEGAEKLGVGWKPSRAIHPPLPSRRTTHPIIVSSRQDASSIDRSFFFVRVRFNETRRSRIDKRKTMMVKYREPTSRVDGNLGVLSVHRKLDENISLSCSRRSSARLVEKYNIVFYIVRSETGVTTLLTRSRSPISRTT